MKLAITEVERTTKCRFDCTLNIDSSGVTLHRHLYKTFETMTEATRHLRHGTVKCTEVRTWQELLLTNTHPLEDLAVLATFEEANKLLALHKQPTWSKREYLNRRFYFDTDLESVTTCDSDHIGF